MPYYRQHRKDLNQDEIQDELAARGMSVMDIHDGPFGDLLVGFQGINFVFEVKNPAKPPSKRKLSDKQQQDQASWRGQLDTIHTAEDAVRIIYARCKC